MTAWPALAPQHGPAIRHPRATGGLAMTNGISLVIAAMIAALFLLDAAVLHWGLPLLVGRSVAQLIEWLSFWR